MRTVCHADQPYVDDLNDRLLKGLRRHRLPAIGFVNESKLDEIDRARQIANLDNHTYSQFNPTSD
jgi:hypothetical protein